MGAWLFSRRDNQGLLNSQIIRSNDQLTSRSDGIHEISTVQINASVLKSSLELKAMSSEMYSLEFSFSALEDCEILVYQFAEEVVDDHNSTLYYLVDTQNRPGPQVLRFAKGLQQTMPPRSVVLDLTNFDAEVYSSPTALLIPLVVEIVGSM